MTTATAILKTAATTTPGTVKLPAIITQRQVWHERGYHLKFRNSNGLPRFTVLFWEDLSLDQKQQMLACVHAGTLTALEAIPI